MSAPIADAVLCDKSNSGHAARDNVTARMRFHLLRWRIDRCPIAPTPIYPDSVAHHMPTHAQDIFRAAFNHAYAAHAGYPRQEEAAFRIAWGSGQALLRQGRRRVGGAGNIVITRIRHQRLGVGDDLGEARRGGKRGDLRWIEPRRLAKLLVEHRFAVDPARREGKNIAKCRAMRPSGSCAIASR